MISQLLEVFILQIFDILYEPSNQRTPYSIMYVWAAFEANVSFMSYSKCWNSRRTWNFCFLLTFSWKKLQTKFGILGHLQAIKVPQLKKDKASKLNKSDLYSFWSGIFSAEYLKDNKDSKFNDNFNTSNMTWTRH